MKEQKERQLTKKEQERVLLVEELTKKLEAEGYIRKDQNISLILANIVAFLITIPYILIFGYLYLIKNDINFVFSIQSYLLLLFGILILTVVHELIHGLVWGLSATSKFKAIEFGVIWKALTPYCTCKEPLTRKQYILGAFMPCLVLGIIPTIISIYCNSLLLFIIGVVMFSAAGGDLTVIYKMLRYKENNHQVIYLDHPCECGYIIFEK